MIACYPRTLIVICVIAILFPALLPAQGTLDDYRRAEAMLPQNMQKLVHGIATIRWIGEGPNLWYKIEGRERTEFIRFDASSGTKQPLFDHAAVAAALAKASGTTIDAARLPITITDVTSDLSTISFDALGAQWQLTCADGTVTKREAPPAKPMVVPSPDGKREVYVERNNLWVRDRGASAGTALTRDGTPERPYAAFLPDPKEMVRQGTEEVDQAPSVIWSPDSRRLVTYRLDTTGAEKLYLVQGAPPQGVRTNLFRFFYPLPGETNVPHAELFVIDVTSGAMVRLLVDPLPLLYYGSPWPMPEWTDDGTKLTLVKTERGWKGATILEIDPSTGAVRPVFSETVDTCIDPWNTLTTKDLFKGSQFIWASERDGWNHLYRYDLANGALINQVTKGEWVVEELHRVDEGANLAYFTANGREAGRDPYLRHLYRIPLDGGEPQLLTPEDADHLIAFSGTGDFFIDTYSRVDLPPVTQVRRADGSLVAELARTDIADLLATGWKAPEAFAVPGRDGKTMVYGLIVRPTSFDPAKRYPVIDDVYAGPHAVQTPKTMSQFMRLHGQSIAELGFVVVYIDGMGTARRSKAFHDVSYKNLIDGGFPDHIAVLRTLAHTYPYLDLERVGVYGFSAGGYNTAQAMFTFGDFYKVGVAASGNYDHRMDKAWWNELWMGFEIGQHYIDQSCLVTAKNLKGKLFLAHGELDENVNPYNTIRLVEVLMKENKEFDLLIVPNAHHYLYDNPYFARKRWDFFVEHLLGVEPQNEYRISPFEIGR